MITIDSEYTQDLKHLEILITKGEVKYIIRIPSDMRAMYLIDAATTHKNCPGKNLVKKDLVAAVVAHMNLDAPTSHPHISEAVHTADSFSLTDFELLDVKWLQQTLNTKLNAGLFIDGKAGVNTKKAVANFQKLANVHVDGIAGPVTRKALKNFNVQVLK